jgi:alpha-glucosidase
VTVKPTGDYTDSVALGNITVLGVAGQVSDVKLNGEAVTEGWSWDSTTNILSISGLNSLTSNGTWNSDWELQWSVL